MSEPDDHQLLSEFARSESESAFAALVARYVNLVYSTALRFTGNTHHAEEISQAVFIILARKAGTLSSHVVLSGWLYQAARLTAANFVKNEIRRQQREQEVYMQSTLKEPNDSAWNEMAPLLDEAMGKLGQTDRDAVVLRFFQNKSAAEIGVVLRMTEETARKRVNRALDKLRRHFSKRGVDSTTAKIANEISAHSTQSAPIGLAKAISAATVAKGAAASTSTLTLAKGAMKIMAWTKAKTAITAGVIVLLAAGTTTVIVKHIQNARNDAVWEVEKPTPDMLDKLPPLVKIVPAKFGNQGRYTIVGMSVPTMDIYNYIGIGVPVETILETAYEGDVSSGDKRILPLTKISSSARYDFIVNLPSGDMEALQKEIKKKLKLTAKNEMIETNVLALTLADSSSMGLQASLSKKTITPRVAPGEISLEDDGFKKLAKALGGAAYFKIPVVDNTGSTNAHYYDLKWEPSNPRNRNLPGLKQALLDQLGLKLVPTNMPVEMLVVEKAD